MNEPTTNHPVIPFSELFASQFEVSGWRREATRLENGMHEIELRLDFKEFIWDVRVKLVVPDDDMWQFPPCDRQYRIWVDFTSEGIVLESLSQVKDPHNTRGYPLTVV